MNISLLKSKDVTLAHNIVFVHSCSKLEPILENIFSMYLQLMCVLVFQLKCKEEIKQVLFFFLHTKIYRIPTIVETLGILQL